MPINFSAITCPLSRCHAQLSPGADPAGMTPSATRHSRMLLAGIHATSHRHRRRVVGRQNHAGSYLSSLAHMGSVPTRTPNEIYTPAPMDYNCRFPPPVVS